jgi:hypothetical protein
MYYHEMKGGFTMFGLIERPNKKAERFLWRSTLDLKSIILIIFSQHRSGRDG